MPDKAPPAPKFIIVEAPDTVIETAWFLSLHGPESPGAWRLLTSYLQQALPSACFEKSGPDACVVHHHMIDRNQHLFLRNGKTPYMIEESDSDEGRVPVARNATFEDARNLFRAIGEDFKPADIEDAPPPVEVDEE